jgi:hypothetical protein
MGLRKVSLPEMRRFCPCRINELKGLDAAAAGREAILYSPRIYSVAGLRVKARAFSLESLHRL